MNRKLSLVLLVTLLSISLLLALANEWEWSLMDDVGIALDNHRFIEQLGWLNGTIANLKQLARGDWAWGLFRPAYWVYCVSVYLLSPSLVFSLRVAMLAISIIGPIRWLLSSPIALNLLPTQKIWIAIATASLFLANRSLLDGLSFFSLQEHSGLFFVGLGLFLSAPKKQADPIRLTYLISCLLIASWLKGPFVWAMLCICTTAIFSWKRRTAGTFGFLVGLLTLITFTIWAKQGSYTAQASAGFRLSAFVSSFLVFLRQAAVPAVSLSAVLITLLMVTKGQTRRQMPKSPTKNAQFFAIAVFGSGVLYLGSLLLWGRATGYYFAPPVYFISFGLILFAFATGAIQVPSYQNKRLYLSTLGMCLFFAAPVFARGIYRTHQRNKTIVGIRNWAHTLPSTNETLFANGEEAAARLDGLMTLRYGQAWKNQFKFAINAPILTEKTYFYVNLFDNQAPTGLEKCKITNSYPLASIHLCKN